MMITVNYQVVLSGMSVITFLLVFLEAIPNVNSKINTVTQCRQVPAYLYKGVSLY